MELIEMNNLIKSTYDGIGLVNSVFNNDPYFIWNNNPSVKYTSFVFDVINVTIGEDIMTYTYRFHIGDRLLNDNVNYNEIYESNYKIIESGINQLLKNDKILSIGSNRNYTFLKQRFADVLAVSYCDVTITTPKEFGNC